MLQDFIGSVLKHILGLLLIYIKAHPKELAGADSLDQILCLYQAAS